MLDLQRELAGELYFEISFNFIIVGGATVANMAEAAEKMEDATKEEEG